LTAEDLAIGVNAVHLKTRLGDVETWHVMSYLKTLITSHGTASSKICCRTG